VIEKEELLSVIPHRGRMLLLSRIVDFNAEEKSIEAQFDITENCLFFDPSVSGVPSWAGFEFIAQAISAFIGIRDRGKKIHKVGYILSVSQMSIAIPFLKSGGIITIKTREIDGMDPVYVFQGEVSLDGEKAVEGKVTVMDVQEEDNN